MSLFTCHRQAFLRLARYSHLDYNTDWRMVIWIFLNTPYRWIEMLTCPPSRINLTPADLATFDRRWAARRSAQREAENIRLSQGAARSTRLAFVPAAADAERIRARSCCSQAIVCSIDDDDPPVPSNTASPPAQRLDLSSLGCESNGSKSTSACQEIPSPWKQIHLRGNSGSTQMPARPSPALDFPIYEDSPFMQAFVEAQHFQQHGHGAARDLPRIRPATTVLQQHRVAAVRSVPDQPQIPTLLYPPLDPAAPVFVPRTRFGSTASISDQSSSGIIETSTVPARRHQSTANLRVRSSFERNTQHSSRSTERHSAISDSSSSLVSADGPQNRRRSRNNDQNTVLQRPLLGFDRYPAVRPPAVTFASRRNSGSQRPVVFPHRRSSRQHLFDFERSRRTSQEGRQQGGSTHLSIPGNYGLRPVSPIASTSSRSTPNLLQPPSTSYMHGRSSSFSAVRSIHDGQRVPARRARKSATTVSESSGLIDDVLLRGDSPLDRIIQKYGTYVTRPRSVGRSFERPPSRRPRPSLLNGDIFGQDPAEDHEDHLYDAGKEDLTPRELLKQVYQGSAAVERTAARSPTSPESVARTPHKRLPTIEDPVALALALPSPEVPSSPMPRSSPIVRSSPLVPSTPILRSGPSSPLLSTTGASSAAKSPRSVVSLASSTQSLAAAVTPRVPVYNDSHPITSQPQTPADFVRSTRRARGRSNTTSTHHSPLSVVQPSPTLTLPERHPHRHTFPSTTPQQRSEVTVGPTNAHGTSPLGSTSALRHDSVRTRLQQRSSNSSENDIEGSLDGLEHDRLVWMGRREDGSLDVTPPREGRFERYLS